MEIYKLKQLAICPLLLTAALIAGSVGQSHPMLMDFLSRSHQATAMPDKPSIGRWLWPGAFEVESATAHAQTTFVASGRRYIAQTRSNGLLIRRGASPKNAIDITFIGAAGAIDAQLHERVSGTYTMFMGVAGRAVATYWQRFSVSTFHDVYPGIDARFHANAGDLELDFLLVAGADPNAIELSGQNGTRFAIDAQSGDILVERKDERFRLHRPRAFQPAPSGETEVAVRAITDGHSLRFEVPAFDHALPLVIDPLVAAWSTFLGTNTDAMYDNSASVTTDSAGNLYVGGLTAFSTEEQPNDSFPTTPGSLEPPNPRSPGDNCAYQCGYVLKLSPSHQILYGALMYGMTVNAVTVDGAGSAYITGTTLDSTNFPATPGVFDNDPRGQAFVSKISVDGSSFVYSALFFADSGNGIAVDTQGNAYVVGQVSGPALPTTPGSIKPSNPVGALINQDGFLLKINPSGSALVYGTYLGGSGTDVANAVQLDSQNEAIIAGQTASSDFVGMTASLSGPSDAFLIKVSADGSQILTGQSFGGSGDDVANGVTADGQGGWIMCGATTSTDFPTSAGAFQTRLLGQRNGWVRRVDGAFNTIFATYFGGSAIDGCLNVASDANANAYLVGVTFSADLPTTAGAFQEDTSAITDDGLAGLSSQFYVTAEMADRESYFAEISSDGTSELYGTYLGGYETYPRGYPPVTIGSGITNSPTGTLYVSGATEAASFPVTDGGLRNGMGGEQDGFIVAFAPSSMSITTPSLLPNAPLQLPYNTVLAASGGVPPYTWSQVGFELPTGIELSSAGVLSGTAANPQLEDTGYQFTVKAVDANGTVAYKSLFLNVAGPNGISCNGNSCRWTLAENDQVAYQVPSLARGLPPETFVINGQLPPGLAVSSTGAMTGQATQTGEFKFSFVVSDSVGDTNTINWDVLIGSSAVPAATLTATPASVTVGQSFTLTWTSFYTSGCTASGGGADGTPWSDSLPTFGSTTITSSTTGSFVYTVNCADGGTSLLKAQATVTVTNGSAGTGSGSGNNGGGGAVSSFELGVLAFLIAWNLWRDRVRRASGWICHPTRCARFGECPQSRIRPAVAGWHARLSLGGPEYACGQTAAAP
jgi:hypothetical protein